MTLRWLLLYGFAAAFSAWLLLRQLIWERRRRQLRSETPEPVTHIRPIVTEDRVCTYCGEPFKRWSFIVDGRCNACQDAASEVQFERQIASFRKDGWADKDDADRELKATLDARIRANLQAKPMASGIILTDDDEEI